MSEEPSHLELLRFARRVFVQQATAGLAQIDRWIAAEERREAERRHGEARQPPPPDWLLQYGLNRDNVDAVHTGTAGPQRRADGACR